MDGLRLREGRALSPNRVDPRWQLVGAVDRANGTTTLYWHNHAAGTVVVWRMVGTELAPFAPVNATVAAPAVTDPKWTLSTVADVTGDGEPDLMWHHQVTGALVAWYVNAGLTLSGTSMLSPSPVSPGWRLVVAR
jgi:hypothetical protein